MALLRACGLSVVCALLATAGLVLGSPFVAAAVPPGPGVISTIAGGLANGQDATQVAVAGYSVAADRAGNSYTTTFANVVVKVSSVTGTISTIAGNGSGGFSGDGGPATSAQLSRPRALAVDDTHNLYVVDEGNSRVRKVAAATGVITTIAGNGTSGFAGDGGPATSAALWSPNGLAIDSWGNVYMTDNSTNRVRVVSAATGIITTIAGNGTHSYAGDGDGGPAISAGLADPGGVVVDRSGNVYVTAQSNGVVRKVAASTGIITTIAGNGSAGFSGDGGPAINAMLDAFAHLALDDQGNLYLTSGLRVRKVTAATGIIDTVAGTGDYGFSGDGGPATSAQLSSLGGVAVDPSGDVHIADSQNHRLRKVTAATGIITTIAGNGGFGDSGDGGPATSAGLWGPLDIAVDRGGDIYVVGLSRVRRVTAATGVISTVAGNGIGAFSGDGGPATDAQLMDPNGIAVDLAGNIYIADSSGRVRKVSAATGIISTIAGNGTFGSSGDGGPATSATVRCIPGGLAVDGGGNVYIADYSARVRKVSAATGIISTIAGNGSPGYSGDGGPATDAQLSVGGGLAVSESGDVFLAEAGNRRVRKVAVATGIVSTIAGDGTVGPSGDGGLATSAQLVEPYGVNVDNAGNVYFSDRNRVRKVALTGIISTFAGNGTVNYSGDGGPATSGGLSSPARVAADAAGNVYISDEGRVRFVGAAVPPVPHDFSGDGCADLVALDVVGTARAYDGNCAGGFRAGTGGALPGDYHPATDVLRGDFSGDGCADNLLLLTNGALYLLAGDCHGGYQPGQPLTIGTGWDAFRAVLSPGDWDGDGCADLLGILPDGDMRLYAGSCASGFKPGTGATIGTDWGAFRAVLSPGDWDGDGCADLLGILSDGDMRLYAGTCAGPFLAGTGLQIGTDWAAFSNVIAPGDWDGDSNPDVLAILPGGDLRLYAGGGSGAFKAGTGARIGIDWAGFRLVR